MIKKALDSLEHVPPALVKTILGGCLWEGASDSGLAALTFDDGPDPEVTPAVLDVLDEIGAQAAFFMLGEMVRKHPESARAAAERGHTIGSHSMSHQRMLFMSRAECETEIDDALKAIVDASGVAPRFFRPPYGVFDFTCAEVVKNRGLVMTLWTVLSGDYSDPPGTVLARIEPFIRPGAIIVFHDTGQGCGRELPYIIRKIHSLAAQKGLRLGSIGEFVRKGTFEEGEPSRV